MSKKFFKKAALPPLAKPPSSKTEQKYILRIPLVNRGEQLYARLEENGDYTFSELAKTRLGRLSEFVGYGFPNNGLYNFGIGHFQNTRCFEVCCRTKSAQDALVHDLFNAFPGILIHDYNGQTLEPPQNKAPAPEVPPKPAA